MRPTAAFAHVALCLGTMTTLTAAWPSWMEEMSLVARQSEEDDGDNGDGGATRTSSEAAEPTGNQSTRRLNTASTLDPDAPRPTKTGSSNSKGKGNSTEHEEFDVTAPAANPVMITPDPLLGPPLYKAGDFVTWAWNYTNLLGTPTAIDLLLACTTVSATWTLTANMSFEEAATYVWDSKEQMTDASQPLLTEKYSLIIKDSDADVTATGEPGYLSASPFIINIYLPKDYTPLSDWNCATCNAARDGLEQKALGFAITMSLITIASFTWFVSGLHL